MIPIHRQGVPFVLGATLVAALVIALCWPGFGVWSLASLLPAVVLAIFFRDPARATLHDPLVVCAPCDGRVADICDVRRDDGAECVRVGVFLSVLDVHVLRSPVRGRLVALTQSSGLHLDARDPRASSHNAWRELTIESTPSSDMKVLVRALVGRIARRIVIDPKPGALLEQGARVGIICFGSRVEITLERTRIARVEVEVGQRVRGGETVIGRLISNSGP